MRTSVPGSRLLTTLTVPRAAEAPDREVQAVVAGEDLQVAAGDGLLDLVEVAARLLEGDDVRLGGQLRPRSRAGGCTAVRPGTL